VGGTDAGAIHLTKAGVPSVAVAVPCRYIHAPVSLMSLNDFDSLVALIKATLRVLPEKWKSL
jgi:endoglucanase